MTEALSSNLDQWGAIVKWGREADTVGRVRKGHTRETGGGEDETLEGGERNEGSHRKVGKGGRHRREGEERTHQRNRGRGGRNTGGRREE